MLLSLADRVAEAGIEPMSMADIQAEVKAARQELRSEREEDALAEEFMREDVAWGLRGQG